MTEDRLYIGNLGPGDIALLKTIASEAAEATTRRWFTVMGLNPEEPITAQRDFTRLRDLSSKIADPAFIADADWTRRTRIRTEGVFGKALLTAVMVAVIGGAHAMWTGLAAALGSMAPPAH